MAYPLPEQRSSESTSRIGTTVGALVIAEELCSVVLSDAWCPGKCAKRLSLNCQEWLAQRKELITSMIFVYQKPLAMRNSSAFDIEGRLRNWRFSPAKANIQCLSEKVSSQTFISRN